MRLPYKNCETWDTLCMIVGWFSLATAAGAQLIDPLAQLFRWRAGRVKRQAANAIAKEVVDVELVDLHGPIHAVFEHERHLFFGHVCVRVGVEISSWRTNNTQGVSHGDRTRLEWCFKARYQEAGRSSF